MAQGMKNRMRARVCIKSVVNKGLSIEESIQYDRHKWNIGVQYICMHLSEYIKEGLVHLKLFAFSIYFYSPKIMHFTER